MSPLHVALATAVAALWGLAFVATKIGLDSFSPSQLTVLRFVIAAVPAIWLPRPRISWRLLVAIGLTLFAGQFLLQFFAIANGMPPGLASVVVQIQAFFTVCVAAVVLTDRPTWRQMAGMGVALTGLGLIGLTLGHGLTAIGLGLAIASAASWSVGNVLVKRLPRMEMLPIMVWLSVIPPLPSLVLSIALDGPLALPRAVAQASWLGLGAALYLGVFATVIAYALWGYLLHRHSTAAVAPFALLAPVVGALSSVWMFGEEFSALRIAGAACMLFGLAIIVLPLGHTDRRGRRSPR